MSTPCGECGKRKATHDGLCVRCVGRAMRGWTMKSDTGRAYKQKLAEIMERHIEEMRRERAEQA